jgi:hypothetical protein
MALVISAKSLLRRTNTMIELLANLDPMTVTTALVGGMGALSTAVVHLYRSQFTLQKDVNDKISKELAECKDDRRSLWQAVLKIDPTAEELRNIK